MTDALLPSDSTPVSVRHPAKFSRVILDALAPIVADLDVRRVLDPFAGVGLVHELATDTTTTVGVEIEPEWAAQRTGTIVGDALMLPFAARTFDAVVTSPTYGNRFADHHNARDGSVRRSYTHDIGRGLHDHNSGKLHWGDKYKDFHRRAWREARRVLCPHGYIVVNVSDHIRNTQQQPVVEWHLRTLNQLGFDIIDDISVVTPRQRFGANAKSRVQGEHIIIARSAP